MIECIEIESWAPRPDLIREVAKSIREGALVACPTDTTYGVFVAMDQPKAIERLNRLRAAMTGQPINSVDLSDKPLSMIFADLPMIAEYLILSETAYDAVKRLLPGPYTIILPAGRIIPKKLQTRRRMVGARIPDDLLVQSLIKELGVPVMSTTAKATSGELLGDAIALSHEWPREIDLVIDSGPFFPEESTVLMVENGELMLIRQGKGAIDLN
jgi:tRNA threonylcarbamoyl adenosine modification protein (Sua5/YciO/YrdC/YwlC family)